MFDIFSRKIGLLESGFFCGLTDFHSHILPSVDDGIRGVEEALRLLGEYGRLGVRKVVFTPHIMDLFPDNDSETLTAEFAKFRSMYGGGVELSLAAEYMLDGEFDRHLSSGDMLTLWSNYLLVETSYHSAPINFWNTIQRIKSSGYFVVLAHPERYVNMSKRDLKRLKDDGVLFQLNLLSLSGFYGPQSRARAMYLLEGGMYDLIGSDIHNLSIFQTWIEKITLNKRQLKFLEQIKESAEKIIAR